MSPWQSFQKVLEGRMWTGSRDELEAAEIREVLIEVLRERYRNKKMEPHRRVVATFLWIDRGRGEHDLLKTSYILPRFPTLAM